MHTHVVMVTMMAFAVVRHVLVHKSAVMAGSVALGSERCHTGGRTIDGASAEAGRSHGRRRAVDLRLAARNKDHDQHEQAEECDRR